MLFSQKEKSLMPLGAYLFFELLDLILEGEQIGGLVDRKRHLCACSCLWFLDFYILTLCVCFISD